jgi:hypothetical protein
LKTHGKIILVLLAGVLLFVTRLAASPPQAQKEIVETVDVSNVIVPVRVFDGKKAVPRLSKDDFKLFLDGKQKPINGFYVMRKKLNVRTTAAAKTKPSPPPFNPRLFVLIFNLCDYHQDLEALMDTFFRDVLRRGDRLMLISNHYFFPEWRVEDPLKTKQEILRLLQKEIHKLRMDMKYYESQLLSLAATAKSRIADDRERQIEIYPAHILKDFFLNYDLVLEDIKSQFLELPVSQYIKVAEYLRGRKIDKWVLNFFQVGRVPLLDNMGEITKTIDRFMDSAAAPGSSGSGGFSSDSDPKEASRRIKVLYTDYLFKQNLVTENQLNDDIGKIFLNSGATFHTMLLKPINPGFSRDFKYQPVATDAEIILKKLSRLTGGSIINSNKMSALIKKVSVTEDIVYMLTYVPEAGKKKNPALKITLSHPRYRLVYDDQKRMKAFRGISKKIRRQGPEMEIEKLSYMDGFIVIKLKNIQMAHYDGEDFGAVLVRFKILDKRKNVAAYFHKTYKGIDGQGVIRAQRVCGRRHPRKNKLNRSIQVNISNFN